MFIHIVGPGDSLFSIGRRYGASVDQIRGVNGLDETNIVPGQALLIPLYVYTVQPGDTLTAIAAKAFVPLERLRAANPGISKCFTSGNKNNDSFDLKLHCGDIEFLCAPKS